MRKNNSFKQILIRFFLHQNDWGQFLLFILLSFGLWLSMRINKPEKDNWTIPLKYTIQGQPLPANFFGDTLHFNLTGAAWEQIKIHRRLESYHPDLASLGKERIKEKIQSALQHLAGKNIRWKDSGRLEVEKWKWKKIPVVLEAEWQMPPYYAVKDTVKQPDSVWVFVPAGHSFPTRIHTLPIKLKGLKGRTQRNIHLAVPPGLKIFPSTVHVKIDARLFEEKTKQIPISFPPAWQGRLMLMPSSVKVHFRQWIGQPSVEGDWRFEVPVDSVGHSQKLPVILKAKPPQVFWWEFYPHQVDYILIDRK